jgi:hypothetical protein
MTDQAEQKTADKRANDPERNVEEEALTGLVDDLAGDEAGDQSENDPSDNAHSVHPLPSSAISAKQRTTRGSSGLRRRLSAMDA